MPNQCPQNSAMKKTQLMMAALLAVASLSTAMLSVQYYRQLFPLFVTVSADVPEDPDEAARWWQEYRWHRWQDWLLVCGTQWGCLMVLWLRLLLSRFLVSRRSVRLTANGVAGLALLVWLLTCGAAARWV
jgi:hypothetical protein